MNIKRVLRNGLMLATFPLVTACITVDEAQKTGDLVLKHSQQLNSELQSLEKELKTIRDGRQARITVMNNQAELHEAYISDKVGFWQIARNKTAQHLYDSLKKSRATQPQLTLSLAPDAKTGKGKKEKPGKLYDPKALEEMIKKIKMLTADETSRKRVERIFNFAKDVQGQLKKQQDEALAAAKAGNTHEKNTEKTAAAQINSSVKP